MALGVILGWAIMKGREFRIVNRSVWPVWVPGDVQQVFRDMISVIHLLLEFCDVEVPLTSSGLPSTALMDEMPQLSIIDKNWQLLQVDESFQIIFIYQSQSITYACHMSHSHCVCRRGENDPE